ncbi:MAG: PilZ domain-containing protein [Gimesia sp.]
MNIILNEKPNTVSNQELTKEASSASHLVPVESISFRRCFGNSKRQLKVQGSRLDCSWNRVLSKVQNNPQEISETTTPQNEKKTYERREFPRHSSEAIVLALREDGEQIDFVEGDFIGNKGYVINVSQNGISFASRSQFHLRDELRLHVEAQHVSFSLDVTASVVRAASLDDQFWRIDCKLLNPLNAQQIMQIKEYASSCYAG